MKAIKTILKKFLNSLTKRKPFRRKLPQLGKIKKVLVISLYFRGDFLFHTTFLEALRKVLPNSALDIWVKSRLRDIIYKDPRFNEVLIFDDIKTSSYNDSSDLNLRGKINFLRKLKKNKYDLIIDLTGKYSSALFTFFSLPKYSIGINYNFFGFCYDKFIELNTSTQKGHLIEKYLSILPIGLNLKNDEWEHIKRNIQIRPYIYIDDTVKEFINEKVKFVKSYKDKPLIILHATSGWKAKELDSNIFTELIKYFNLNHYNFVFIGDEDDAKKLSEIKSFLPKGEFNDDINFLKLKLIQSAELIRQSDLFIGSDSAPLHIAGAVGTPSIGIFGPTNPEFSKPLGEEHKIIYHRLVCSASDERQYCTRNAGFTCPSIDCMKSITTGEIIQLIEKMFYKRLVEMK